MSYLTQFYILKKHEKKNLQLAWKTVSLTVVDDDSWSVKSSVESLFGFPHNPSTLSSSKIEGDNLMS